MGDFELEESLPSQLSQERITRILIHPSCLYYDEVQVVLNHFRVLVPPSGVWSNCWWHFEPDWRINFLVWLPYIVASNL